MRELPARGCWRGVTVDEIEQACETAAESDAFWRRYGNRPSWPCDGERCDRSHGDTYPPYDVRRIVGASRETQAAARATDQGVA